MTGTSTALLSLLLVAGAAAPAHAAALATPASLSVHVRPSGMTMAQTPAPTHLAVAIRHIAGAPDWLQQYDHPAVRGAPEDHFGGSVALDRTTAIVGAPGTITHIGTAYIFARTGTRWTQQAKLAPDGEGVEDYFGRKVVLSGDTALVTAPGTNKGAGAAYVYVRHGGRWTQQAQLVAGDGAPDDNFASSAALDGDSALLGAWGKNKGAGAAYIFHRHGTGWTQVAQLVARDGAACDGFGGAVALSGDTALVGAWFKDNRAGAAYVFVRRGSRWVQQAQLNSDGHAAENWFGTSVALGPNTAVIGAPETTAARGAVYIFTRIGSHWSRQAKLTADDQAPGDWFGRAVALSGNRILVGAWLKQNGRGAAYLFSNTCSGWVLQTELTAADRRPADYFAGSLALNGDTALVGAWGKGGDTGAAYVFAR
jgi:FG-GAP repeat